MIISGVIDKVLGRVISTTIDRESGAGIFWVPNLDGNSYGDFLVPFAPTGAGSTLLIKFIYTPDGSVAQILDGSSSAFSLSVSAANILSFNLLTGVEIDGVSATSGVTELSEGCHIITGTLDASTDIDVVAAIAAFSNNFMSQIHEITLTDPLDANNSVLINTCISSSKMPTDIEMVNELDGEDYGIWNGLSVSQPYVPKLVGGDQDGGYVVDKHQAYNGDLSHDVPPSPSYIFNGSTMYATMADWTPNGLPFSVEVNAIPLTVDSSDRYLISSSNSQNRIVNNSSNLQNFRWRNAADTSTLVVNLASPAVVGVAHTRKLEALSDGLHGSSNGEADTKSGDVASAISSPIVRIGSAGNSIEIWHGPIWGVKLTDNSPIQNTDVCIGNSTRYGELLQPINLVDDFEIEFDWIRQDSVSGTSTTRLFGSDSNNSLRIYDTGHASNANLVQLRTGGAISSFNVSKVALGQHARYQIIRQGNGISFFVDGVQDLSNGNSGNAFPISQIGAATGVPIGPGAAIQNLVIQDTSQSLTYTYPLNEGAGTVINNTDPTTGDSQFTPISDTSILDGNGTRYIEIPTFSIGADDDWEISWDAILQDRTGTNSTRVAAGDALATELNVADTGATQPDQISLVNASTNISFNSALASVVQGQHYSASITKVGVNKTCIVDGVEVGTSTSVNAAFSFDVLLARAGGLAAMAAGATFQNLTLHNTTTGDFVHYKIDEGAGTNILAYDKLGGLLPAKDGTVTPDAAWSAVSDQSKGEWTPDVDWQNIPNNSREYPMHDGTSGNGVLQDIIGGHDATIQNYDENNWQYSNTHVITSEASGDISGWSEEDFGDINTVAVAGYDEPLQHVAVDSDNNIASIKWAITGLYPEITGLEFRWDNQDLLFLRTTPTSDQFIITATPGSIILFGANEGIARSISISVSTTPVPIILTETGDEITTESGVTIAIE